MLLNFSVNNAVQKLFKQIEQRRKHDGYRSTYEKGAAPRGTISAYLDKSGAAAATTAEDNGREGWGQYIRIISSTVTQSQVVFSARDLTARDYFGLLWLIREIEALFLSWRLGRSARSIIAIARRLPSS